MLIVKIEQLMLCEMMREKCSLAQTARSEPAALDDRLEELQNMIVENPSLSSYPVLGRGSYGSVHQVSIGGSEYALKKMSLEDIDDKALRREISISQSLKPYPTIVNSIHCVRTATHVYILMDLVTGTSMNKPEVQDAFQITGKNSQGVPVSPDPSRMRRLRSVVRSLLRTLVHLHSSGVIHRDIKGANIVLADGVTPRLLDWGIARSTQSESGGYSSPVRTRGERESCDLRRMALEKKASIYFKPTVLARINSVVGTPYFLPPELINGSEYGYEADVWSMGVTIFKLMTGKYPFEGREQLAYFFNVCTKELAFPKEMPVEWVDFLSKMLAKDPRDRLAAVDLLRHPCLSSKLKPLV